MFDTPGVVGATFGPKDGHLDGYAMLMGYRAKAISLGASYIEGVVAEFSVTAGKVTGVRLATSETLASPVVINCAGAWAAELAATAGVHLPVDPVKRQVFVVDTEVKPETPLPLVNLASGLYFRSEGDDRLLVGKSLAKDPVGFDFAWEEKRFTEQLWPELAGFVPAFDRLKLKRGWAGLYAVNRFDGNAILGEWPELAGLYLANGFSGHGLQQAPAVGRYLSELITGRTPTLDLSVFGPERLFEGKSLDESELI
jgi:glycine/D-amino acid oxidase-like deaminating enzyme